MILIDIFCVSCFFLAIAVLCGLLLVVGGVIQKYLMGILYGLFLCVPMLPFMIGYCCNGALGCTLAEFLCGTLIVAYPVLLLRPKKFFITFSAIGLVALVVHVFLFVNLP